MLILFIVDVMGVWCLYALKVACVLYAACVVCNILLLDVSID